jgi:hypothetical protein
MKLSKDNSFIGYFGENDQKWGILVDGPANAVKFVQLSEGTVMY